MLLLLNYQYRATLHLLSCTLHSLFKLCLPVYLLKRAYFRWLLQLDVILSYLPALVTIISVPSSLKSSHKDLSSRVAETLVSAGCSCLLLCTLSFETEESCSLLGLVEEQVVALCSWLYSDVRFRREIFLEGFELFCSAQFAEKMGEEESELWSVFGGDLDKLPLSLVLKFESSTGGLVSISDSLSKLTLRTLS